MTVKTITVTEEAYLKIKSMKMPYESFSDLFSRLSKERNPLWRIVGMLPKEGIEEDRKRIREMKERGKRELEARHARFRHVGADRANP